MTKVLIADDAFFMRQIIKHIVIELGMEVCGEAENGKQAVEKAICLKPDIITMDVTMPVMNGLEAVKEIRVRGIRSKIIMCTALNQESLVMEALKSGADDFVIKPFREEALKNTIEKMRS